MDRESIARLPSSRGLLYCALFGVMAFHAVVLFIFPGTAFPSNACTAAIPFIAGFCCLWRSVRVRQRSRPSWIWISIGLFIWAAAQLLFTFISGNNWNLNPTPDFSDLLFFDAQIPFFLAISNTYDSQSGQGLLYLNAFQAAMATVLTYIRLFKIEMSPGHAGETLYQIYWAECLLLALAGTLRLLAWSTAEERRRTRVLCATFWMYLPVEVLLDYPSTAWQPPTGSVLAMMRAWQLPKGEWFELLWSVPFLFLGVQALRMPIERGVMREREKPLHRRRVLLLRSFFPMMITCALFVLAVSVARYYFYLGLAAILLLLVVQGIHSGVIQVSYLMGQTRLIEKEKELKAANLELERQSMLDPVTGIPNRRYFSEALEAEWKRALRKQECVAILMLDLDYFKAINDAHGHLYGDDCLIQIAQALRQELQRSLDVIARYGGEEFIVLLPDTSLEGAGTVAAGLQNAVAKLNIVNKVSPHDGKLTVSIGIAAASPSLALSRGELIARADRALYRAKREGRNRICWDEDVVTRELPENAGQKLW